MKKNNKPAAKRYMKTVGMVMASVMVLSSTTGQMVYAESAKDQKDTQDGEKKEEKTIVYLNGKTGNDKNSGESQDEAVKSFEKAAELRDKIKELENQYTESKKQQIYQAQITQWSGNTSVKKNEDVWNSITSF